VRRLDEPYHILDEIHGLIRLSEAERAIVDSPYFQRLRHIKQLGLAHMVFPGADHTRFSHSLGTLHIAATLCVRFGLDDEDEARLLRMAALLHDVGHFPLSHTLEKAYSDIEDARGQAKLGEDAELGGSTPPQSSGGVRPDLVGHLPHRAVLHEDMGRHVIMNTACPGGITDILHKQGFDEAARFQIAQIITAGHQDNFYNQFMHSELDADQMDYLIRDATATGSKYGLYDLDYLLDCLCSQRIQGNRMLCVGQEGLRAVEHYALARYFYYAQILYHKTRLIVEKIATRVWANLLETAPQVAPSLDTLKNEVDSPRFVGFQDSLVWQALNEVHGGQKADADTNNLIEMLLRRQLPKPLAERQVRIEKSADVGEHEVAIRESWKSLPSSPLLERQGLSWQHEQFSVAKTIEEIRDRGEFPSAEEVIAKDNDPIRISFGEDDVFGDCRRLPTDDGHRVTVLSEIGSSLICDLAGRRTHVFRFYGEKKE